MIKVWTDAADAGYLIVKASVAARSPSCLIRPPYAQYPSPCPFAVLFGV